MNIIAALRRLIHPSLSQARAHISGIEPSQPWPRKGLGKGEPTWSLFAEDPLASGIVREWCARATTAGVNQKKIIDALQIAERMDRMEPGIAFTLRGQDQLAPLCISLWVGRAKSRGAAPGLIASAESAREAFMAWQPKKLPD